MRTATLSPECMDRMCSACRYEDCGCRCHLTDTGEERYGEDQDEDER